MYRVRISWDNAKSQVGAFKVLENAINACKKAGSNYKVYNSNGKVVYPENEQSDPMPTPTPSTDEETVTPATIYTGVKIGSSSKDEYGSYRGGQAGDQTGAEVWI